MNTIAAKGRRLLKFALAFAVMSSISSAPAFAKTDVHVLDVGQGLSVLVKSQDHCMLYDGGDRDRSDYVVSYLKQQGIAELDYMIASHYDADHINGLVGALNTTSVKQVFAQNAARRRKQLSVRRRHLPDPFARRNRVPRRKRLLNRDPDN